MPSRSRHIVQGDSFAVNLSSDLFEADESYVLAVQLKYPDGTVVSDKVTIIVESPTVLMELRKPKKTP
jgi:hypothetical protein